MAERGKNKLIMATKIIIQAELISQTEKAWHLNCEGDNKWFPKSVCKFSEEKNELEAPLWVLKEKFPNENL